VGKEAKYKFDLVGAQESGGIKGVLNQYFSMKSGMMIITYCTFHPLWESDQQLGG
jgi:desulfoferrodoxin (superoxide reductase-like protein)